MLADSRLVRNLSAKLQELAGGFTKVGGPFVCLCACAPLSRALHLSCSAAPSLPCSLPAPAPPATRPPSRQLSPQVNRGIAAVEEGEEEAPDAARKRLEERLQLYCLVERRVPGDGSCQFASLSDQLYRRERARAVG